MDGVGIWKEDAARTTRTYALQVLVKGVLSQVGRNRTRPGRIASKSEEAGRTSWELDER
jgi:hypothetical protein